MLDLGWQEFFLIATIAVVVVGPKDLPKVIRTIVGWIRKVRSMARDFQGSIEEVAREAELDEVRKEAAKLSSGDLKQSILDTVDPDRDLSNSLKEAKADIEAGAAPAENAMLDPATAESRAAEDQADVTEPSVSSTDVQAGEETAIKGWDAESVTTPASSITPPSVVEADPTPASEPKPAKKPRATKKASADKADAAARKTTARKAPASTAKTKPETKNKTKTAGKPRKPRASAKPKPAAASDTPVTEA